MQWYSGNPQTLFENWEFGDNPFYADYQVLGPSFAAVSVMMGVQDVLPVVIAARGCATHIRFTVVAWGYDFNLGPEALPFIEVSKADVIQGRYAASDGQIRALQRMISKRPVKLVALISNDDALLTCADLEPLRMQLEAALGITTTVVDVAPLMGANQWTGYDRALGALFGRFWDEPVESQAGINLVGWKWPSRERKHDIGACLALLEEVGVRVNAVLPGGSKLDDFRTALGSQANLLWCPSYIGETLERLQMEKGIPLVGATPPYGLHGTMEWLSELGEALGQHDVLIARAETARQRVMAEVDELRERLAGKRGFVSGGPGRLPGLLHVMSDLQVEVVAAALFWPHATSQKVLPQSMQRLPNLPAKLLVAPSLYEIEEIACDQRPDFWMGGYQEQHACKKYGIPFIPITVYTASHQCFEGVVNVGKKICKALDGFDFVANPFQAVEE